MCAERRLTSGELDELILKCLADGMGLHRIMQELYGACGVWLAVFDTSSGTIFCVPDGDAGRMDVLERLKRVIVDGFLAGDAKTVALLGDGKPVVFGPDEESGRLHVCGVASPHTEPRSIISAGISDESWLELGHELLSRLCRLYEFFNRPLRPGAAGQGLELPGVGACARAHPRRGRHLQEPLRRPL